MLLRDYREADGQYDAIVSVEMIEAVGEEYWPTYFAPSTGCSRPAAGSACRRSPCRTTGCWPRRDQLHLDPQVHLPRRVIPSVRADRADTCAAHTGLRIADAATFGADYARHAARSGGSGSSPTATEVDALGFDDTFRRMWDFYLAYCEAGFPTGYLDVAQLVLSDGAPDEPAARVADPSAATRPSGCRRRRPAGAASGPGTAARPGRRPARRSWCSATGGRCAACCGSPASSAWPGPT